MFSFTVLLSRSWTAKLPKNFLEYVVLAAKM